MLKWTLIRKYAEFVADHWLVILGYDKVCDANNPFSFMEMINLQGKTNFFEKRVSEYQKAGIMSQKEEQLFVLDEYF